MQKFMGSLTLSSLVILSACQPGKISTKNPESKDQQTMYALGASVGERLKELELKDDEINWVVYGLVDGAKGATKIKAQDFQQAIQEKFMKIAEKAEKSSKESSDKFMEKFINEEGGMKTESGLGYKIINPGSGKKPKAESTVQVHYHGTLVDGTIFDSSVERGEPVDFPLNRVIKGWTEGLQLVGEGGKIRLVVPFDLGYGPQGFAPKIPPYATLVFDVDLIKVVDASAKPAAAKGKK